jgi:hypothetical protein
MPRYVIERNIPGAGSMSDQQRCAAAETSNNAIATLAPRVQWETSYFTADRVYCVFIAEDEKAIAEHAALTGFPATRVERVAARVDPTAAENA